MFLEDCIWFQEDGFGWFWVVVDGCEWFRVVCCFNSYGKYIQIFSKQPFADVSQNICS